MYCAYRGRCALAARLAYGVIALVLASALASCTVGPAYQRPAPPKTDRYTAGAEVKAIPAARSAQGSAAGAQELERGVAAPPRWWQAFGSAQLNQLVTRALTHNPDLTAAQATLAQAQFELQAAQGAFYPQVSLALGGQRSHTSGASRADFAGARLYNLYTGEVSVSYDLDVFGLHRLAARGAQAQVDLARDQLAAARLMIEGNVMNATLDLAALTEEVAALQQTVADQRQILDLTRTRYKLGAASKFDLLTQQSQLASSQAHLQQLQQGRDQTRHLLATYLGAFPSQTQALPVATLDTLHLPASLPVRLPSTLVRSRPDIRAAQAQLRAANARIAEAVARMYPTFELTGDFGGQTRHVGNLFDPASRIWDLAAGLLAPLFEGGTLRAQKNASEAAYRAVFADYQSTVLAAFREVADVLRALQHDSAALDAEARALHSAHQAFDLVRTQYRAGAVDYLHLLTSETQYQNARIAFVEAQTQRYADTAALYVALGGSAWEPKVHEGPSNRMSHAEPESGS